MLFQLVVRQMFCNNPQISSKYLSVHTSIHFNLTCFRYWKDLALNESLSDYERSKLAVWDYPISDKFTKMWQSMKKSGLPDTFDEAVRTKVLHLQKDNQVCIEIDTLIQVARVRESTSSSSGYAFLGDVS